MFIDIFIHKGDLFFFVGLKSQSKINFNEIRYFSFFMPLSVESIYSRIT